MSRTRVVHTCPIQGRAGFNADSFCLGVSVMRLLFPYEIIPASLHHTAGCRLSGSQPSITLRCLFRSAYPNSPAFQSMAACNTMDGHNDPEK